MKLKGLHRALRCPTGKKCQQQCAVPRFPMAVKPWQVTLPFPPLSYIKLRNNRQKQEKQKVFCISSSNTYTPRTPQVITGVCKTIIKCTTLIRNKVCEYTQLHCNFFSKSFNKVSKIQGPIETTKYYFWHILEKAMW